MEGGPLLPEQKEKQDGEDSSDRSTRHRQEDRIELSDGDSRRRQRAAEDQNPDKAAEPACRLIHVKLLAILPPYQPTTLAPPVTV